MILFIQAFVNVVVASFLMKTGAVGFDGTKFDYLKSLFIFFTTGFVVVLFVATSVLVLSVLLFYLVQSIFPLGRGLFSVFCVFPLQER